MSLTCLMCGPEHYDVVYEINPWMSVARRPDAFLARRQWEALFAAVSALPEATVQLIPQQPRCPDMVFTANAGLVVGDRVLLSRFRRQERTPEEPHFEAWFRERGYRVVHPPEGIFFEGEGDALFVGDVLVTGYAQRSDFTANGWLSDELGCLVLSLFLPDPRWYHLDTCFLPLGPGRAAYCPAAFDRYGIDVLRGHIGDLIEVPTEEGLRFACNAVVAGDDVALPSGCPQTATALMDFGYRVHALDTSEFIKAGGSCKCLTLTLGREPEAS